MTAEDVNLEELVKGLESDLGLPAGFFSALPKEDDWSFVIKLHALFEGAVTHMLLHKLGFPRLGSVLARLELGDPRIGKLAFARELDVLDEGERRFLTTLSRIRNQLVHDARRVTFQFKEYLKDLDENQLAQFLGAFQFVFADSAPIAGKQVRRDDFVRSNPKLALWLASMGVLANIYQQKELARLRAELTKALVAAYGT
jgi:hypothetical protein